MALTRCEAVVVRTYPLGDTSRIAVLYSREFGIVRGVAKGARGPKSPFGAGLEPLSIVDVVLYRKDGRDLDLLSKVNVLEDWRASDLVHQPVDELEHGLRVRDPREVGRAPVLEHVDLAQEVEVAAVLAVEHDVDDRQRLEPRAELALRPARTLGHAAHEPELAAVHDRDPAGVAERVRANDDGFTPGQGHGARGSRTTAASARRPPTR